MLFGLAKNKTTSTQGKQAEKFAKQYLKDNGICCIAENYHCKYGEIDLIAEDNNTLVFVEVRYRSSAQFGSALASVTEAKQKKLRLTAQHCITQNNIGDSRPMRFDVIGITQGKTDWIQNAF